MIRVKAIEVEESCCYVTVGKVYDCHDYLPELGIVFLTGDRGNEVIGVISSEKDAHGVKWELVKK